MQIFFVFIINQSRIRSTYIVRSASKQTEKQMEEVKIIEQVKS